MKIKSLGLLMAFVFAYCQSSYGQNSEVDNRPNIVLILADDLGIGDVSAYNRDHIPTPNIDRLGVSGIRFADAHVSAAVCMPSRAGLITGRQGTRHGSEFNAGPGLDPKERTIADFLKAAGYRTGVIGKWHLGSSPDRLPQRRGFDEFYGLLGGASSFIDPTLPEAVNGYNSPVPNSNPQRTERVLYRGNGIVEETGYLTDALTRESLDFIERNKKSPFFLYVSYNAPHTPHQTTRKYYDRFPSIKDHDSRVYAAMVAAVDDGVGAIIEKLRADGLYENTLLVFLSDNGGPDYFQGGPSNASFSGWKRYHLEGGHRVPFFISWPIKIPGGKVESALVSSLDLLPTFAAAAGVQVSFDKPIDGVNLLPYLSGKVADQPHQNLFWRAGANFAVRDGKWKLIVLNKTVANDFVNINKNDSAGLLRNGPFEGISPYGQHTLLYNLTDDPSEKTNIAIEHPDVVESLTKKFELWNKDNVQPNAKSSRGIPTVIDNEIVQLAF
jgi:arylsulfatase A-like enzyme